MKKLQTLILSGMIANCSLFASEQNAQKIKGEYDQKFSTWSESLKVITAPELRLKAMELEPSKITYAKRLWPELKHNLTKDWTLPYLAWIAPELRAVAPTAIPQIQKALEEKHIFSADIGKVLISLSSLRDPNSLKLARKVKSENPDARVKGEAALATALMLAPIGEGPEIMKERIKSLSEAVIHAADSKIGNSTVGEIAEDQLYYINNLMKGRTAPALKGADQKGVPIKLGDYKGKIVVLTFWSGITPEAEQTMRILRDMQSKFIGKEIEIVGVSVNSLEVLRKLTGVGSVTWRNFSDPEGELAAKYQVGSLPFSFVIDREGKIEFSGAPGAFIEMSALGIENKEAKIDLIRLDK